MKILRYDLLQCVLNDGQPVLLTKAMTWSEENEEVARKEAYNGEYTIIEDDGYIE